MYRYELATNTIQLKYNSPRLLLVFRQIVVAPRSDLPILLFEVELSIAGNT